MKSGLTLIAALALGFAGATISVAQSTDAVEDPVAVWEADRTHIFAPEDIDIDALIWVARPLIIFAESANDPLIQRQLALLADRSEDLAERDVLIILDTDSSERSALRDRLRPRGFMLVLIDKDGRVALRKPSPWDVRELSRSIDKTPLRQQEIRERRAPSQ